MQRVREKRSSLARMPRPLGLPSTPAARDAAATA